MKLSKKYVKVLFLVTVLFLGSCTKEDSEQVFVEQSKSDSGSEMDIETVSLSESRDYFNKIQETKLNKTEDKLGLKFDFKTLRLEDLKNSSSKIVVMNLKTKFSGLKTEALQLRVNNQLETVLLHKNKKGFDVDGMYTGPVICTDFQGNIHYMFKMEKNKILGEYVKAASIKGSKRSINSRLPDPCWGITCGIWLNEVVVTQYRTTYVPGVPRIRNPFVQGIWGGTNFNNTYAGYAAGYMSYMRMQAERDAFKNLTFDTRGSEFDPQKELECFSGSKGGKLTVYVQQPREGTVDLVGPNSVGHAFVGLEQDGNTRVFGFYPPEGASSTLVGVGNSYPSELASNAGELYHVSISTNVSASQMNNLINFAENHHTVYNVNNYACTDFAIGMGNLAGLNLPSTTVSGGMGLFKGRSPAVLGEEIRRRNSNSTSNIRKNKGNAPKKTQGKCQ